MGVKIVDTDHGYRQLVDTVFRFENPQIEVGILEADGAEEHQGAAAEKGDEPITVADVASWMEFGFHHVNGDFDVLPRSFVRAWFDSSQDQIRATVIGRLLLVIAGKITKDQALSQIGLWCAGQMQRFIASGKVEPPLAESTIKAKGSSKPLINTGQLRSSISFRVKE